MPVTQTINNLLNLESISRTTVSSVYVKGPVLSVSNDQTVKSKVNGQLGQHGQLVAHHV